MVDVSRVRPWGYRCQSGRKGLEMVGAVYLCFESRPLVSTEASLLLIALSTCVHSVGDCVDLLGVPTKGCVTSVIIGVVVFLLTSHFFWWAITCVCQFLTCVYGAVWLCSNRSLHMH